MKREARVTSVLASSGRSILACILARRDALSLSLSPKTPQANLPLFIFILLFFILPLFIWLPPHDGSRFSPFARSSHCHWSKLRSIYSKRTGATLSGPLCELCPSKNSPTRAMLTPSAGPSANAAADLRHKATSSVFSSACGCRSSANHTSRSRRILAVAPHCHGHRQPCVGASLESASIQPNEATHSSPSCSPP